MKTISLEELTARSKSCEMYPALIRIARASKSPTAAFEEAGRAGYGEYHSQSCRYLAIIKRDHGKKVFEDVVAQFEKNMNVHLSIAGLAPFVEAATRISYLAEKAKNEIIRLMPYDKDYALVAEEFLDRLASMDEKLRQEFLRSSAYSQYLSEVRQFVNSVKQDRCLDQYCLSKTAGFLIAYFNFYKKIYGLDGHYLTAGSTIDLFVENIKLREKVTA